MEEYYDKKIIGKGTYGKVYKCIDKDLNKVISVKELDNEDVHFTTVRELKSLRMLRHKNIVECYKIFHKESFHIVMEYVDYDLSVLIERKTIFSEMAIKTIIGQICSGLEYMHSLNLIHRDIKPGNILISEEGVVKIIDFGLTREISSTMTHKTCSLWYRAPELLLGKTNYDEKVDAWPLGCIIYEMITKKILFSGNDELEQIHNVFNALGSPTVEYPLSNMIKLNRYNRDESWVDIIGNYFRNLDASNDLIFLLGEFLNINPKHRLSAKNYKFLNFLEGNESLSIRPGIIEVRNFGRKM
ncbi:Cdc2-like kinase [Spraguea lophii 42_110]|uniref:Cyclin-dependent kinase 8 n=1 Tax=Spraguea lophii (strain 42_110) TaxID=1358809 RepID=S7W5S0_SPRLO|nr:Cdc2-like kinase [Spraguea lophii 42_110]